MPLVVVYQQAAGAYQTSGCEGGILPDMFWSLLDVASAEQALVPANERVMKFANRRQAEDSVFLAAFSSLEARPLPSSARPSMVM